MTRPQEVRALSLWQPWATLIADGLKRYETRRWGTSYRGPLLIHAAKRADSQFADELWLDKLLITEPLTMPAGVIVAVADLVNVHYTGGLLPAYSIGALEQRVGDFGPGRRAWELAAIRKLAHPVKAQGHQGLWTPAPHIVEAVVEQVGAL